MNALLMLTDKNIPLAAESIKEAYATRVLLPRLLSLLLMSLTERLLGISCDFHSFVDSEIHLHGTVTFSHSYRRVYKECITCNTFKSISV